MEELRAVGGLDERAHGLLLRLVGLAEAQAAAAASQRERSVEWEGIMTLQEQLRKNLGALGESEREVALRGRLLDDLEVSEERRRVLAAAQREAERQAQARERERQALIAELYAGGESGGGRWYGGDARIGSEPQV